MIKKRWIFSLLLVAFVFVLFACDKATTSTTTNAITTASTTALSSDTTALTALTTTLPASTTEATTATTTTTVATTATTTVATTAVTTTESTEDPVQTLLVNASNAVIISNSDNMTASFVIPAEVQEATVSWTSNHPEYISIADTVISTEGIFFYEATVSRPNETTGDVTVTLTGTFAYGESTYEKNYSIRVRFFEDPSSVTTIAEGLMLDLGTYITWESMTVVGIGTDGFFFTDGIDLMFVYHSQLASLVEVGKVYDIYGGVALYNSIPEVQNIETNIVSADEVVGVPKEVTPTVATIAEIIANHVGYNNTNPMNFGIYTVTGSVYYDAAGGDYSTYLVPAGASTLDKTNAIRIYYKSDMTTVSAYAGQTITLDLILFGYNSLSTRLDWYAYFFGTSQDITAESLTDADKLSLDVNKVEASYEVTTQFTLPTLNFGTYSEITISSEISDYLSYASNEFTVIRPETDTAGTISLKISVNDLFETLLIGVLMKAPSEALPSTVIIYEAYGGGGNVGATYKNDYIVLYNTTDAAIDLSTYSVQYASVTGTSWQRTNLTGSIAAHGYYLIQEAQGAGGTTPLPTPNVTGTIAMSGTNFKLALVSSQTLLTGTGIDGLDVVDFVGCGATASAYEGNAPAPAPSNTTSIQRVGSIDTDQNGEDYIAVTPNLSYLTS